MTTTENSSSSALSSAAVNAAEFQRAESDLENLRTLYRELCTSYRAIDDFRAKLLAALPLATVIGIFLAFPDFSKSNDPKGIELFKSLLPPISLFGFVITLGLFIYEVHGIRRCTNLIVIGQYLEQKLGFGAQFVHRASSIAGFISEPLAAGVIYSAVLAIWTLLGLYFACPVSAIVLSTLLFLVGSAGSIFFLQWIRSDRKKLQGRLKNKGHC
jgi:hypothetical protein